jgi:tetratricopeptide (TPR) repeat protein
MPDPSVGRFTYRAFISYSHRDKAWADWLHKALETYRVPSRLVGTKTAHGEIPRRLNPIFRDREELSSSPELGTRINEALARSENLIVLCSPGSATSRWVNEEVLAYKRMGRGGRIFCVIVDGEPNATDLPGRASEECFCPALRFQLDANGQPTPERTEPIAADARPGRDGKANAKLKLIAGMLDVGFDALKQREQQRRIRRMTAITALALVVMAITSVLAVYALISRHQAVAAQHEAAIAQQAAERRQKQAEDLVNFMLGDLNDKLSQINRLDIIESVDDKAMDYFKSLPTSDVTAKAIVQRAKALERIGSVRLDQGHLPAALDSFHASLKLISAQARKSPKSLPLQLGLAEVTSYIGTTYWFQGKLEGAEQNFRSAKQILSRVEKQGVGNSNFLNQMLYVENNLGHVLESRGKLDEARASYQTVLDLAQKLVAADPGNVDWNVQLGASHNNLGKLALTRGDMVAAIAEYAADDKIETSESERHPKNNDQRQNMFRVRAILGRTLALAGQTDNAIRDLRDAVNIADGLHKQDTTITSISENLALYRMQLSRLLRLTDELPEAMKLTDQSFATFAALTKQDPSNASWQREFAEVRTEHAAQLATSGKYDEAQAQLQDALGWLDPALKKHPEDRATLLATVDATLLLATVQGDSDARTQREDCLGAIDSVTSGTDDPRLLALKVDALLGLGRKFEAQPLIDKLRAGGYRDPAFVQALQRAHIDYPPNTQIQEQIQIALSTSGNRGASL